LFYIELGSLISVKIKLNNKIKTMEFKMEVVNNERIIALIFIFQELNALTKHM